MQQDVLSDALSSINNAVRDDKDHAWISPTSNLVKNILIQLQQEEYIGVFELVEDGRGGKFKVEVTDRINQVKPIKPRFHVGSDEYRDWAKRYLPARNFGHLLVTTPKGVKTHREAREENVGGKILGYVY